MGDVGVDVILVAKVGAAVLLRPARLAIAVRGLLAGQFSKPARSMYAPNASNSAFMRADLRLGSDGRGYRVDQGNGAQVGKVRPHRCERGKIGS